ncbi:MAG TPA: hypothetical protein VH062_36390 [Polyangiaceae bacterium]|nr:hypothetical protein [Polyangiaceae bacterium]
MIAFALSSASCSNMDDRGSGEPASSSTGGATVATQTGGGAGARPNGSGGVTSAAGMGVAGKSAAGTGGSGAASNSSDASAFDDAGSNRDASDDGTAPGSSCLDGITNYESDGPFKFETKTAGNLHFFVPAVPVGCKIPVVYLAGGTGAVCDPYVAIQQRLATHGFLAVCNENITSGDGTECVTALDAAFAMYPSLIDDKIGVAGHEQGGGATFMCVQQAEAKWGKSMSYAGLAMEPASGLGGVGGWMDAYAMIRSPMFMFSGSLDAVTPESFVQQSFDALSDTDEAYWYSAIGATSIPVPIVPTQQVAIPWFRWKLLHDGKACAFFKQMPDGADWDMRRSQNERTCR